MRNSIYQLSMLEEIYQLMYYCKDNNAIYDGSVQAMIAALRREEPDMVPQLERFLSGGVPGMVSEENMWEEDVDIKVIKHPRYMPQLFHMHDFFKLIFVYSGQCKLLFSGSSFLLNEGDFCILPPKTEHCFDVMERNSIAFCLMIKRSTFDKVFLSLMHEDDIISTFFRNAVYQDARMGMLVFRTADDNHIPDIILEMYREYCEKSSYNRRILNCYFELLISYLLKHYERNIFMLDETMGKWDSHISQILKYIQESYAEATLTDAAAKIGFSPAYLSRMVKNVTGKAFSELVKEEKMKHACIMLKKSDITLDMIAEAVGYNDASHFSKVFKELYGVSPGTYRQKQAIQ